MILTKMFVEKPRVSLVGDHLLNSHNPNVLSRGDSLRRNEMLVTLKDLRVNTIRYTMIRINQNPIKQTLSYL